MGHQSGQGVSSRVYAQTVIDYKTRSRTGLFYSHTQHNSTPQQTAVSLLCLQINWYLAAETSGPAARLMLLQVGLALAGKFHAAVTADIPCKHMTVLSVAGQRAPCTVGRGLMPQAVWDTALPNIVLCICTQALTCTVCVHQLVCWQGDDGV